MDSRSHASTKWLCRLGLAAAAWFGVASFAQAQQDPSSRRIDLSEARQVSRSAAQVSNPSDAAGTGSRRSITTQARRRPAQNRAGSSRQQDRAPQPLFQMISSRRTASDSPLRRAAHGETIGEPVPDSLMPASYHHHVASCDGCSQCAAEPACGCEGPVCECGPVCGAEPIGGLEPGCGVDVYHGPGVILEPACGAEGIACGQPGCADCGGAYYDPACGAEPGCDTIGHRAECVPVFLPLLPINWCRFEFFGGVQGFTGPANYAAGRQLGDGRGAGSFGFHQGFNEGRSLREWLGIDWASQFGVRATQNNIDGTAFTNDGRNQVFLTAGLFRRVDYGLQMGVVYDYLNDDWFYHAEMGQVRGELSWKTGTRHEFGYRFMAGVNDSTSTSQVIDNAGVLQAGTVTFQPTDQHRIFYRYDLGGDGWFDGFVGTTDSEDTIFGMDVATPLRGRWGLRGGFVYLNPGDPAGGIAGQEEGWNVSMSVVWRPCGRTGKCDGYSKPLFQVADNGTFMADQP